MGSLVECRSWKCSFTCRAKLVIVGFPPPNRLGANFLQGKEIGREFSDIKK